MANNLITALHEVGAPEWVQEGVEFEWVGNRFVVANNALMIYNYGYEWARYEYPFASMCRRPDLIKRPAESEGNDG